MATDLPNAWAALLGSIVPERRSVGLLQAMLWDGAAARARWAAWAQTVGDPRKFFEKDYRGRKGLLAFLSHRLSANGIDAGEDFATYARVAQVREELRSRIFIDTLRAVQSAMDAARLEPIVVNGAAYAFTVYAEPLVRHNHGIDLWLPAEQVEEAGRATAAVGFRHERTTALPRGVVETYRHRTGLELDASLPAVPHAARQGRTGGRADPLRRGARGDLSSSDAGSRRPSLATRSAKAARRRRPVTFAGRATRICCCAAPRPWITIA